MEQSRIVIMLDLQKTLDFISDETAAIFMNQISYLRKTFQADEAIVFISSQSEFVGDLYASAAILKANLLENIKLGDCYYYNGSYNPNTSEQKVFWQMNENKIQVLKQKYLTDSTTKFFAVVDDYMRINALNEFQMDRPFLFVRPSQCEDSLKEDHFSCYSSCSFGFDGVIDGIDRYLQQIQSLSAAEIFEMQKQELFMITGAYASQLLEEGKYDLVLQYVENNKIIGYGYHQLSYWIQNYLSNHMVDKNQYEMIMKILASVTEHLEEACRRVS